jgi:hypothetical protein
MARIITKEIAKKIVKKLKARKIDSRSKAHDEYEVTEGEILLGIISIRRGSDKNLGHDYIPGELHFSPHQARNLAQCPWSRDDYLQCMREKGFLPAEEEEDEAEKDANDDGEA